MILLDIPTGAIQAEYDIEFYIISGVISTVFIILWYFILRMISQRDKAYEKLLQTIADDKRAFELELKDIKKENSDSMKEQRQEREMQNEKIWNELGKLKNETTSNFQKITEKINEVGNTILGEVRKIEVSVAQLSNKR